MFKPILSICIPTFNNSRVLKATIDNIIGKKIFHEGGEIEIVVSDNCSNDDTGDVCKYYIDKYPDRFIYSRNSENLGDLNFGLAISKGNGKIRKLHNNYYHFLDGALEVIVKIIKVSLQERPVIFLANGFNTNRNEPVFICENFDQFIRAVSFQSTWIGGFFIWEEDFISPSDFSRFASKSLSQTDILFRMVDEKKKSVIINEKISYSLRSWGRGGYNIAQIFGENYISLLKIYLEKGVLSRDIYELAKKRVLLEHILPYLVSDAHGFKENNVLPYLSDYQWNDYFYLAMLQIIKSLRNKAENKISI